MVAAKLAWLSSITEKQIITSRIRAELLLNLTIFTVPGVRFLSRNGCDSRAVSRSLESDDQPRSGVPQPILLLLIVKEATTGSNGKVETRLTLWKSFKGLGILALRMKWSGTASFGNTTLVTLMILRDSPASPELPLGSAPSLVNYFATEFVRQIPCSCRTS